MHQGLHKGYGVQNRMHNTLYLGVDGIMSPEARESRRLQMDKKFKNENYCLTSYEAQRRKKRVLEDTRKRIE